MVKAGHHRLKAFLHFFLASGGNAREGAAVKGIERGDDFVTAFVVAEFARKFEQSFVGLHAAVAEETLAGTDERGQLLREPALRPVIIKIGSMDELARLLDERLGDGRRRMTERADGNPAAEVEVAFARDVPHLAARAVAQHEVEAAVGRHDVLLKQRLYLGGFVTNDRRRLRNYLFHLFFTKQRPIY